MIVDFRRKPPCSPPTYHHEQHCDCSGVIQVPGHHHLPGPEVGQSHRLHCEKGPAEAVLLSPAEEVQPATGTADTVLLCRHWISLLHINNCLVQLSYQIWPQKSTEGSLDCWANHWYKPSLLSKNCTYPEWAIGLAKSLWTPHIQHTTSLNCYHLGQLYRALSTRKTRHRNSFFPQAIHLMSTWQ